MVERQTPFHFFNSKTKKKETEQEKQSGASLVPSRRGLPVSQHILHRHFPLILEARSQLLRLLSTRMTATPHLRATSFGSGKGGDKVAVICVSQDSSQRPRYSRCTKGRKITYSSVILTKQSQARFQLRLLSGSFLTSPCAWVRMSPQKG